jgi:hypothetical protein
MMLNSLHRDADYDENIKDLRKEDYDNPNISPILGWSIVMVLHGCKV